MDSANRGLSDEVLQLVQTVGRLDGEDQERILRLVRLLAVVSPAVRDRTHGMLRELLDSNPHTMYECVTGMNELIAYLESCLPALEPLESFRQAPQRWN